MARRTFSFSADEEILSNLLKQYDKKELHEIMNEELIMMCSNDEALKNKRDHYLKEVAKIDKFLEEIKKTERKIDRAARELLKKYANINRENGISIHGLYCSFKNVTKINCDFKVYLHLLSKYRK